MPTYAFHHYSAGDTSECVTFAVRENDAGALDHAREVLTYHSLRCVEVCDDIREVGLVRRENGSGE